MHRWEVQVRLRRRRLRRLRKRQVFDCGRRHVVFTVRCLPDTLRLSCGEQHRHRVSVRRRTLRLRRRRVHRVCRRKIQRAGWTFHVLRLSCKHVFGLGVVDAERLVPVVSQELDVQQRQRLCDRLHLRCRLLRTRVERSRVSRVSNGYIQERVWRPQLHTVSNRHISQADRSRHCSRLRAVSAPLVFECRKSGRELVQVRPGTYRHRTPRLHGMSVWDVQDGPWRINVHCVSGRHTFE